jgi:hypothetical protein
MNNGQKEIQGLLRYARVAEKINGWEESQKEGTAARKRFKMYLNHLLSALSVCAIVLRASAAGCLF